MKHPSPHPTRPDWLFPFLLTLLGWGALMVDLTAARLAQVPRAGRAAAEARP